MIAFPNPITTVRFPKDCAADANAAMDVLFSLFADHYPAQIGEDEHEWFFRLSWPVDPSWYVDPQLTAQADRLFGCSLADLPLMSEDRSKNDVAFIFSMFHSRALLAPALARQRLGVTHFSHIVHVDDHEDMMAPLLEARGRTLFDPISRVEIDLSATESIMAAIDRGVIHKGSFLASYVLAHSPGSIIHVCDRFSDRDHWLAPRHTVKRLGHAELPITTVEFTEHADSSLWHFRETSIFPRELSNVESVWLDVDLDEFCNRFDGDSNRRDMHTTDAERSIMSRRIDNFLIGLMAASWKNRVRAVSVAASPAFFPSEYWNNTIPKICEGIATALGI